MGGKKPNRRHKPQPSSSKHVVDRMELMDSTVSQQQRDQVRSYLDSLSSIEILDLFIIRVSDIKDHYSGNVEESSNFLEALSFAEANGSWKFWTCFRCKDTSADFESHKHHMRQHLPKLPPDWESISPQGVSPEWVKMIMIGHWEPIDIPTALTMLQQHPQCRPDHLDELWPLSNDLERVKLLQRIHIMFRMLLNSSMLCAFHIECTLQFAMREAKKFPSSCIPLTNQGHKQPSLFFRFLVANKLEKILWFLQDLSELFVRDILHESGSFFDNSVLDDPGSDEVVDGVYLVRDSTKLVLDACPFYRQSNHGIAEGRGVPDTEAVVSWLYKGPSVEGSSLTWYQLISGRAIPCAATICMLEKKFELLNDMSHEKCNRLNYWNALQTIKHFCLKELKKEEDKLETMSQKLKAALMKGKEELVEKSEKKNDAMADAISAIYRMVQSGSDGNDSTTEDYLDQLDEGRCITLGFYELDDAAIIELAKIDAKIMSNIASIDDLQLQLDVASALDYLAVVVPLVKHFLRVSIEHEAEKYATKKAEAARRALLAELENDDGKGINSNGDNPKQAHENSKHKKNGKDSKKFKG